LSTDPQRWLSYARRDLALAERLAGDPAATPRHVCMWAQQAAEKALGAALVYSSTDVLTIRNLDALQEALPTDWQLSADQVDLAILGGWSAESQEGRGWPDATDADTKQCLRLARAIMDSVVRGLRQRGFDPQEEG